MKRLVTIFMLILSAVMFMMNAQLQTKERHHDEALNNIKNKKADYVFGVVIRQINQESQELVQVMKHDITNILLEKYNGRMDDLKL